MLELLFKEQKLITSFTTDYKDDIEGWSNYLENSINTILSISRKGPRIIDLLHESNLVGSSIKNRTISEYALPFINDVNSISIIDDLVVYGSTLNEIYSTVKTRLSLSDSAIEAIPFKYSCNAPDKIKLIINKDISKPIFENHSAEFTSSLITSFKALGKPYDIEHPIIYIDGDFSNVALLENILNTYSNEISGQNIIVNSNNDIYPDSYTILIKGLNNRNTDSGYEFSKIRIYVKQDFSRIAFVPIAPCLISREQVLKFDDYLPEEHKAIWDYIKTNLHSKAIGVLEFKTLVVLANYLISLSFFKAQYSSFKKYFGGDFYLKSFDLQLLVGFEFSKQLKLHLTNFLCNDSGCIKFKTSTDLYASIQESFIPKEFEAEYNNYFKSRLDHVSKLNSEAEIINLIFHAQHYKIEVPSRSGENFTLQTRLKFGITLNHITFLISNAIVDYSTRNIHAALDKLIDSGAIVPKYAILNPQYKENPVWGRIFRVGEGSQPTSQKIMMIIQLFNCLKSCYSTDRIPALVLEKYSVMGLTNSFNFKELQEQGIIGLGIKKKFSLYGARSYMQLDAEGSGTYLLDWAENLDILKRDKKDNRYSLNDNVITAYNVKELAITDTAAYKLEDIGSFCHLISTKNEDQLITVTTLASKKEYWLALSAELDLWLNHWYCSIYNCIHKLEEIKNYNEKGLTLTDGGLLDYTNKILVKNANFTAQVVNKKGWFESYDTTINNIDGLVTNKNDKSITRVWVTVKEYLKLANTDNNFSYGIEEILAALRISHIITSICRTLLNKAGLTDKRLASKTIESYLNDIITRLDFKAAVGDEKSYLLCQSFEKHKILDQIRSVLTTFNEKESFPVVFNSLKETLIKITDSIQEVYNIFGIPPNTNNVSRTLYPPVYIIMWDMRKSTSVDDRQIIEQSVLMSIRKDIQSLLSDKKLEDLSQSLEDGGSFLTKSFHDIISAYKIITKYAQESDLLFRVGCDVNFEGDLHIYPELKQIGGRAYEYAARTTNFFKEANIDTWDSALISEPNTTYLIVGEFVKRIAEANKEWDIDNLHCEQLDGLYSPRVKIGTIIPYQLFLITKTTSSKRS